MPLILSLDTSSTICSVALHDSGSIVGLLEVYQENSHGAKLAVIIKQVIENAGYRFEDLAAVAVSAGPGSYTGLRIGTSTAKGLCYSLGIPLLSVDSLTIMASAMHRQLPREFFLCPMLDARRMEVYCAVFNRDLEAVLPVQAKIIDESSFSTLLAENKMAFFGNGALKCREIIGHPNAFFADGVYPSASELGYLAHQRFADGRTEDLVHFEPIYLKEFLIKKSSKIDSILNK
jgi:tRNA threonylcarbamoyladenosine biosynthesis protein TsaB